MLHYPDSCEKQESEEEENIDQCSSDIDNCSMGSEE
jgi:hypothetical protein